MIASFSALGIDLPSIALIVLHKFGGSVVVVCHDQVRCQKLLMSRYQQLG